MCPGWPYYLHGMPLEGIARRLIGTQNLLSLYIKWNSAPMLCLRSFQFQAVGQVRALRIAHPKKTAAESALNSCFCFMKLNMPILIACQQFASQNHLLDGVQFRGIQRCSSYQLQIRRCWRLQSCKEEAQMVGLCVDLYPIERLQELEYSGRQLKVLHIVRHAQGTHNVNNNYRSVLLISVVMRMQEYGHQSPALTFSFCPGDLIKWMPCSLRMGWSNVRLWQKRLSTSRMWISSSHHQ